VPGDRVDVTHGAVVAVVVATFFAGMFVMQAINWVTRAVRGPVKAEPLEAVEPVLLARPETLADVIDDEAGTPRGRHAVDNRPTRDLARHPHVMARISRNQIPTAVRPPTPPSAEQS
jgi:hypothetical protein